MSDFGGKPDIWLFTAYILILKYVPLLKWEFFSSNFFSIGVFDAAVSI